MNAFLKKEAKEILKTYRLWAVPVLLLFLGLSAPAAAKFMPEILESQLKAENITIKMPEQTAVEAFGSYFKNLSQVGLLAVILFSMGLISDEKAKGILAQIVVKPVARGSIVVSKFLVHGAWLIVSLIIAAAGCYFYTLGLFGEADAGGFFVANIIFAVYALLIFALTLSAGAMLGSQAATGAVALTGLFVLSLLPVFSDALAKFSPAALVDLAHKAAAGPVAFKAVLWPAAVTLVMIVALLGLAVMVLERQEL